MKDYIQRLKDNCSAGTYAFWWVIRLAMIGMVVKSFFDKPFSPVMTLELFMNLCAMFTWELCLALPKWTVFRYIKPVMQTIITVIDFIAVITAYMFNFYFEIRLWDTFLHFMCGVVIVYFGYEFACALVKKQEKTASLSLILLASVGFCFMCTTFWEIFEFSGDQLIGLTTGEVGRSQFWSYEKLYGTPKFQTIFEYIDVNRYAIMDTMGDIVVNTAGALLGLTAIRIYPYRHKGRFKLDYVIPQNSED